ncbi:MAG TPA: class I SAM-dependent methyltransferase [Candidatus Bathyarchaeia archaeon]|nr:class I SAM-dependent methyltransferase [Candidatus Bathyarchaeia archaeon]
MSKDSWLDWYQGRRVEESVVELAKTLKEAGASRILDLGCGTGRNTVYLARLGFQVYGFDWSAASVTATKRELSKEQLDADLRLWDMTHTRFPYIASFFDGILAMRVIHHTFLGNIKRIGGEIERITKPGSVVYVEVPTFEKGLKPNVPGPSRRSPGALYVCTFGGGFPTTISGEKNLLDYSRISLRRHWKKSMSITA